ncbi:MAG TPA: plastocyanin/azurin family copper-binding protein [Solirubrobacterales bacterium]|nr:plastocyanin/azurin family copper-binding protein [Solirubrobacterales bacterium]HMX71430.1 plastocyanin/azurin family copper-binding protein [Solirubrobacterales bacterium]HMY25004.1 plastocyanin/azurin family copper-binding protein [Solirubrobacterales bacterium]HNA23327.1 plastocyanin/azurin family copper-binding protein [Solirubrobacterales bacterium]HNC91961.1 plastocyanin/azurin family copper-binding protein [Solirubrobacterales bacterium]
MRGGSARKLRVALVAVAAASAAFLFAAPATANNTWVSISDFQWSDKNPHIDLGESVTWLWAGPDTPHSVTGQAPRDSAFDPITTTDASQWDSDAGRNEPNHWPGDEYTITFDHPGTYLFACKLHSVVRGEVTVSNLPGNPDSSRGPRPKINFDFDSPVVDDYFFTADGESPAPPVVGPRGRGIGFRFSVNEATTASADYYQLVTRGKGSRKRLVRVYRGYGEWPAHVGINRVGFARPTANFKPAPGRYLAWFRAEDRVQNSTGDIPLRFTISPGKGG